MRSARHDLQPVAQLADRGNELGIGLEPELRDEPRRPQHAQRVVEERHLGRERRAEPPGREVGRAAERVDERRVGQPRSPSR